MHACTLPCVHRCPCCLRCALHTQGRELRLAAPDRVGVYRTLVSHMKAHFRDDVRGKRMAFYFLPWHFNFFCRCACGAAVRAGVALLGPRAVRCACRWCS
jgi:hypothetical protein